MAEEASKPKPLTEGQRKVYVEALQAERAQVASRPDTGEGKATKARRLKEIDAQITKYGDQPGRGIETA